MPTPPVKSRLLLTSIHDVAPRFEGEVDRLFELVGRHVGERQAMLVVPDHWGDSPLVAGSPFATRLRDWADRGVEMFLHGWFHRDLADYSDDPRARFKAQHLTAGEGEFLGLDRATARDRILRGRGLVEDVIGRPIAGFIAPAWLYGDGARQALADAGITLAEDHLRVWNPATGQRLLTSPVITWASRTPRRLRSSLLLAAAVRRLPMPGVMRVGVHPPDIRVPALVASIDATLGRFARTRRPGAYADLQAG